VIRLVSHRTAEFPDLLHVPAQRRHHHGRIDLVRAQQRDHPVRKGEQLVGCGPGESPDREHGPVGGRDQVGSATRTPQLPQRRIGPPVHRQAVHPSVQRQLGGAGRAVLQPGRQGVGQRAAHVEAVRSQASADRGDHHRGYDASCDSLAPAVPRR
jgi:hypothetical protein